MNIPFSPPDITENEIDEVINDLYFHFKDMQITSYNELHNLLSKESLINTLKEIGKAKY